jgi:hypothetical protein
MTRMRRMRSFLREIQKEDGQRITDYKLMGDYIKDYFEHFHKSRGRVARSELLDVIPQLVS